MIMPSLMFLFCRSMHFDEHFRDFAEIAAKLLQLNPAKFDKYIEKLLSRLRKIVKLEKMSKWRYAN